MLSDFRFVFRALARQRVFAVVTICTLALGIGGGGAIFSVTDYVLFRMNDFPHDVFLVGGKQANQPFAPTRLECMMRAYEGERTALRDFAKAMGDQGNVVVDNLPVATSWVGVTPNLFPMLKITPWRGRGFLPGEDKEGADQVVVVSHQFWKNHLGGRDDALGRKITLGSTVCTVVGVLREGQTIPVYLYSDVYRPLTYRMNPEQPWWPQFFCLAQLAPGVTREQAQAALRGAKVDVPASMAQFVASDQVALSSLAELNQLFRPEVHWLMLGAVACLYAIACLNASNLMLVRMLGMRRELAIRLALGGGRARILRLLALECVVLASAAALLGVLLANWLFPLLLSATGGQAMAGQSWLQWRLDGRVLGVMAALTVVTSALIALVPVWRVLRADINTGLKDGGGAVGESRGLARLRGALVVLQAAFAVVLLAGAGLMIRTFSAFQKVDLGFEPAGLTKIYLGFVPTAPRNDQWEARLNRLREIQAQLERLPGVQAAGFGGDVLLPGWYYAHMEVVGPEDRKIKTAMSGFGRGLEKVAGLRLKRGHWLQESRGNEVLVNEALARALWPGVDDPTGQFVRPENAHPDSSTAWKGWAVAGVVADIRSALRDAPGNHIYGPEGWGTEGFNVFVLRHRREFDSAFADAVRRELYAFDPTLIVHRVVPVSQLREQQLWTERMANSVLKVLAAFALLLTVVGIFSVLAYAVDQRKGEFGVRLAFGATPRDLALLVLRRGVVLAAVGVVLGIAGALALTRTVQGLLFGVSGNDPWVLGGVAVLLVATAIAACVWPARRAAQVDVTQLMRSE